MGCLHVRPALNTKDPVGVARMRRIAEHVADLVVELGGSISGEHGDGLSRSEFLGRMYGPELVEAFATLKRAWDPAGLLNPGVIVAPRPLEEQLRLGPGFRPGAPPTALDFSRQGGFEAAVELCNGSGLCRKRTAGRCARPTWPPATSATPPAPAPTPCARSWTARCRGRR